jgi:hypothetical protein
MRYRLGRPTSFGQTIHGPTGDKLLDVLRLREADSDFLIAVPDCIWDPERTDLDGVGDNIEATLQQYDMRPRFYERDSVLDDAAKDAQLFPLIKQLRQMKVVLIGNEALSQLDAFPFDFVGVSSPNLHLEHRGIERAVSRALDFSPDVYLVSAGVSAALIIDQLWDQTDAACIDCGSIWDAFVGIGGQREWRAKLYKYRGRWARWKQRNLTGV